MRRRTMALLAAGALVLAACSDDDDGGAAGDDAPSEDTSTDATTPTDGEDDDDDPDRETTDPGGTAGTATTAAGTDRESTAAGDVTVGADGRVVPGECVGDNVASPGDGVTEDSVNVSIVAIDFEALANIGFAATDRDPSYLYEVFVDELNDNGGVCGRTIDLQRVVFDILQGEGGQACVEATEDRDNLVIQTTGYDQVLCLTDAGVPVYAGVDVTVEEMDSADGLLFTRFPSVDDQYRATVQYALDAGALDGSVGLWYGSVYQRQTEAVEDVVIPMLDDAGVDYSAFRTSSVGPSDPEGNAILTAAATDFATRDVDTVLHFVQNTNHTGMQTELAAQGRDPRHISMPISANVAVELFAERFGTREIADGQELLSFTIAPSEVGGEDELSQNCHEIWTRRTGETIETNTFDYNTIVTSCVQVDVLAAALSIAGGDLTRDRFIEALEALPAHPVPPILGEVDWSADDRFGPAVFTALEYDGASNTLSVVGETFELDQ